MSDESLQTLLKNIMSELSDIRNKIDKMDDKLMDRLNNLENRVTILETQLNTTKSFFSSSWVQGFLKFSGIALLALLAIKIPGVSAVLAFFK